MKKKTFISLLILTMTSIAGAEIMISLNGDTDIDEFTMSVSDTVTIGIYNAGSGAEQIDFDTYLDFYYKNEGGYSLSNARVGPAIGDFDPTFKYFDYFSDYDEYWISQSWSVRADEIPGTIFLVDLHRELTAVDIHVELWDGRAGYSSPVDTLVIHDVPEPATLLLLGIGAVMLRKRR